MDLSTEELSQVTSALGDSLAQEFVQCIFGTVYVYHYLTTVAEEVGAIWPQRWRTGRILFTLTRYTPLLAFPVDMLIGKKVHTTLTPNACEGLWMALYYTRKVTVISSELVLLLCLHALLGARHIYLISMLLIYASLTITKVILLITSGYITDVSLALPISSLDQYLGYACTWGGTVSPHSMHTYNQTAYISFANGLCTAALALAVIYVRYRAQTGSLIQTIRRDSGIYILSLIAVSFPNAIIAAFHLNEGWSNIIITVLSHLQCNFVPIVACRLLLNIRMPEDRALFSRVSTLLFEPGGRMSSLESNSSTSEKPHKRAQFLGIGRTCGMKKGKKEVGENATGSDGDCETVQEV
ncbi:hypothetical protein DFP72DRAFT_911457 [Ephemerocybe angulata]|uniref:DUF6533 domain-containing protein n=1 Tax=Ephemerocybe angulata TaxID=980116 RepID=A0A8H6M3J5_9AGAR|nr:hypothetical protein DFP72DRAFT_911457 [Tulosesus angulatus]